GYFPLAQAFGSILQLAVDTANSNSDEVVPLSLNLGSTGSGSLVLESLCSVLDSTNSTHGVVAPLLSSQASLLGSLSNRFWSLPIISLTTPAAMVDFVGTGKNVDRGFLSSVQPGIDEQMAALTRLIVDMKTARDALDGRANPSERVAVLHTADSFGTAAAQAFALAAAEVSSNEQPWDSGGVGGAWVDVVTTVTVAMVGSGESGADLSVALSELVEHEVSITVLLAEGFDGGTIRAVLRGAREMGLVGTDMQWYLSDSAAMDGIFAEDSTTRDSRLAFDMRGTLGLRPCAPVEGEDLKSSSDCTT
ncbi:unnamed protein product, partial [Choristocarpus tenellus]